MSNNSADEPAKIGSYLMKYRTELYAYIFSVLHEHNNTEDVLQEVSLAAIRSWEQFTPGTNFKAWVREIARRRILNFLKESSNRKIIFCDPEVMKTMEKACEEVEQKEPIGFRRKALDVCIKKLEGLSRKILELKYAYGKNVEDISRKIGKTVQAVYSILKRSRYALKDCVEKQLEGLK